VNWDDIKVLGLLAKHGTVRATAKVLKIHHTTVSRRIEELENAVGARLFDRLPEGYALTEAGEHLVKSAEVMDSEVVRAQRLISGGDREMAGRVKVTMAEPVAVHAFAPRMPEFFERYPKLEVEIKATTSMVDLSRRKADVAIRMNNNPPENLFGKRLFPYYNAIYASPDYLARHDLYGAPEKARWIGWDGSFETFPWWTAETRFSRVPVHGNFPALDMQAAMVRAGAGIAILPCFIGDRDPGLVRVTDDPPVPFRDIWILTHSDLRRTTRIRAFMKFAEDVINENRALLTGDAGVQARS